MPSAKRRRSPSSGSSTGSGSDSGSSSGSDVRRRRRRQRQDDGDGRHGGRRVSARDEPRGSNDGVASKGAAPSLQGRMERGLGRTGGVYIPPFKLAQMQREINDKSSVEYQRLTWDGLRKSINGLINKVNVANMKSILPELFEHNLVRGRGLFARALMKAQLASPGFTHIYAGLLAVVNTKMPENGELVVKRVVVQFRRAFKRNNKVVATALVRFIAHLVNQQVAHEVLSLQVLMLLLERPTDDSVEVAIEFTKAVGMYLFEVSPQGLHGVFERFRAILHEGDIDKRVQYTIEGLFAVRKSGFADHPAKLEELDLVESDDQITHEISLDDELDKEELLDVFKADPNFLENEKLWAEIRREVLGEESSDDDSDSSGSGSESDDEDSSDEEDEEAAAANAPALGAGGGGGADGAITDMTEADLVAMRRTIYLTIMSSLDFEECAHKLMKINIAAGYEHELINMLIECCTQERTYLKYYGLLGARFCMITREYQDAFETSFAQQYSTIHRLETNKLRNLAKFFAHLLNTDSLPWTVFEYIHLNEDETTSSSRIFIKILTQELAEQMGLVKLRKRFFDARMESVFASMFPKDNPRNTRFAINFFTAIGLGALTDDLRNHLKNAPKRIMAQQQAAAAAAAAARGRSRSASSSSSSSSSSSGSSSSGSSSGSSSSSSSGSDDSGSESD